MLGGAVWNESLAVQPVVTVACHMGIYILLQKNGHPGQADFVLFLLFISFYCVFTATTIKAPNLNFSRVRWLHWVSIGSWQKLQRSYKYKTIHHHHLKGCVPQIYSQHYTQWGKTGSIFTKIKDERSVHSLHLFSIMYLNF